MKARATLTLAKRGLCFVAWLSAWVDRAMVAPEKRIQRIVDRFNALHLKWAMRELHPLHPEIPEIVRELAEIERRSSC